MPELLPPTTDVHASFLEAMDEFQAEGRGAPDDDTMVGDEIRRYAPTWYDRNFFAHYVQDLHAEEHTARSVGWVACTTLWYVERDQYLGRLAIRHRLTEHLRNHGGHVGYDVRPSARRQGHATAMLRAAIPIAGSLGLDDLLVTCNTDNVASRKVIEGNGGRFEDERDGKLRFWVAT